MSEAIKNKGWTVVTAGLAINLALGVLYAWSIFKGPSRPPSKREGRGRLIGISPPSMIHTQSAAWPSPFHDPGR